MYNCGPTPYDEQHIGNMVPALLGNLLRGSLEAWGYTVAQVTNITDFGHLSGDNEGNADIGEDRMSRGLKREGWSFTMENMRKLAEKYTEIFLRDIKSLGVPIEKIPFPRASEYVKEDIELVKKLEEKGYAYKTSDGIYFDTSKMPDYGILRGGKTRPSRFHWIPFTLN
jgi:cysteinyl-tRNA synthetase